MAKAEQARLETERILREQQVGVTGMGLTSMVCSSPGARSLLASCCRLTAIECQRCCSNGGPPSITMQEAVEKRKAEMAKRDEERERLKREQAEARAAANEEAQRQAHARITAAQEANKTILQV